MYLDQERAITDSTRAIKKSGIKVKPDDRILCLSASNEGIDMELLYKIAEIIESGKKKIFVIGKEPGETALGESGLFSLTIGFR